MLTNTQMIFGGLIVVLLFWFLIAQTDKNVTKESKRLRHNSEAMRIVDCIHLLREQEGDAVEILCDNREAETVDTQMAIHCTGDWTDFGIRRFEGSDLLSCLEQAVVAREPYDAKRKSRNGLTTN